MPDVGLHDGELAVLAGDDEVAGERDRSPAIFGGRRVEQQVDRPHHRVAGQPDKGAVVQERGVESHERVVETGELAQPGLHLLRHPQQGLGEARHHRPLGQALRRRQPGGEAPVHEDQPRGGLEVERRDLYQVQRVGIALRPVEGPLDDGADVGQPPLLLAEGGEAEGGETLGGHAAQGLDPGRLAVRLLALQALQLGEIAAGPFDGVFPDLRNGHRHLLTRPPAQASQGPSPRARSNPSPPAPGPAPCRRTARSGRPPARARSPGRCS